jgi:hypothetical protein
MPMKDQKSMSYTINPVTNDMALFVFPGSLYEPTYAECDAKRWLSGREPVTL